MAKVQFNCRLDPEVVRWIDEQAEAQTEKLGKRISQADVVTQLVAGQPFRTKPTRVHKAAVARRAADPLAQVLERDDFDYINPDELPSAGSVGVTDWRAGRKPLLKPSEGKK